MKVVVLGVGRLKPGPERALVERYHERLGAVARPLGFVVEAREVAEGRARSESSRKTEEAAALLTRVGDATLMAFDEGGKSLASSAFAKRLAVCRDSGCGVLYLVVGGPDGLAQAVLSRSALTLSFGAMTLPHQLVRILVVEQLYRAMTILSGHPYHRGP